MFLVINAIERLRLVQPNLDTKPGTVSRDLFIDLNAEQLANFYNELRTVSLLQSFLSATGNDLSRLGANFGVVRNQGTNATGVAVFTTNNLDLDILILDGKLKKSPVGQIGQIALRGAQTIDSYYLNRSLDHFSKEWFLTGDLGFIDKEGFLYFKGRMDDMINRGGYHFHPQEVEKVLDSIFKDDLEVSSFCIAAIKEEDCVAADYLTSCPCGRSGYHCLRRAGG